MWESHSVSSVRSVSKFPMRSGILDTDCTEDTEAQATLNRSFVRYGPSTVTAMITGDVTSRPLIKSMDSIFSSRFGRTAK